MRNEDWSIWRLLRVLLLSRWPSGHISGKSGDVCSTGHGSLGLLYVVAFRTLAPPVRTIQLERTLGHATRRAPSPITSPFVHLTVNFQEEAVADGCRNHQLLVAGERGHHLCSLQRLSGWLIEDLCHRRQRCSCMTASESECHGKKLGDKQTSWESLWTSYQSASEVSETQKLGRQSSWQKHSRSHRKGTTFQNIVNMRKTRSNTENLSLYLFWRVSRFFHVFLAESNLTYLTQFSVFWRIFRRT